MSDSKLDPLFEDFLKGTFPAMRTRAYIEKGRDTFPVPSPSPLPPMRTVRRSAVMPTRLPDIIFDAGNTGPASPTGKSMLEEIEKVMALFQRTLAPPTPLSKHEERLYNITADMGYVPVADTLFALNHTNRTLLVDVDTDAATRLLAISHELGHATRISQGKCDNATIKQWHRHKRMGPKDEELRKLSYLVMREEVMAWREGMRILRKIGVKFNSARAIRDTRTAILASYRYTTKVRGRRLGALALKES